MFLIVLCLELAINKYQPLTGKSYIDLPIWIRNKKAVINVKNNNNECFAWSITAAENPKIIHPERVTKLIPHRNNNLFKDIEFPVPLDERVYKKFEDQAKISINVLYSKQKRSINWSSLYNRKRTRKTCWFAISKKENLWVWWWL